MFPGESVILSPAGGILCESESRELGGSFVHWIKMLSLWTRKWVSKRCERCSSCCYYHQIFDQLSRLASFIVPRMTLKIDVINASYY